MKNLWLTFKINLCLSPTQSILWKKNKRSRVLQQRILSLPQTILSRHLKPMIVLKSKALKSLVT